MPYVSYNDGTASDVEYAEVNFDELTSCYTYNPLFTAIKSQSKTIKDENNFFQWIFPNEEIHFEKSTNDGYLDLIWLYGSKPVFNQMEGTKVLTENEKISVITKMDLQKYRYVIDTFTTILTDDNIAYSYNTRDGQTYTELQQNEKIMGCLAHWENIKNNKTLNNIYPVIRYVDSNGAKMLFYPHATTTLSTILNTQSTGWLNLASVAQNADNIIYLMLNDINKSYNYPANGNQFIVSDENGIAYIWYSKGSGTTELHTAFSYNKFLEILALLGVYFRIGGVDYLGFMDNSGQTTGEYLTEENWDKSSQYNSNTINNFTSHEPPYTPPPEDDESDDINFGYMFSGAGAFTNLWYCTQKDLADLRQWFLGADAEHPIPEGFDPMPSIIGLFQYPISLGGDVLEEIKFRTSSGLIVSTGVQAARGLSTNLKFDLGSINIPARMRERGVPFLDYESTVECYVPFCGVFQLDTQTVIGKTLSCTLWMSPATGECNCIVYTISNGIKAPVAYGSGNMSSQIPISSNGWGSYAAALKNATIQKNQIISGALTGGVSSIFSGAGNQATMVDLGEQIAG